MARRRKYGIIETKCLSDYYIKKALKMNNVKTEDITPELINLKREQLILFRERKEIRELINGSA